MTINMYKVLQTVLVEKDVENIYRDELLNVLGRISTTISSKYGTDGIIKASRYKDESINLSVLLECKYDTNFKNRLDIIKVLIQALYYLNRFEYYGEDLPNVIMVGDRNECFCLHSNNIKPYLDFEGVDWSIAPSSAVKNNTKLLKTMMGDEEIIPYIFEIDENFKFEKVIEKAVGLSKDQTNFVRITEKNIDRVFNDFISNVLYHNNITKEMANKLVNVFLSVLINPTENYIHPNKPQTLVTKNIGNVRVDGLKFKSFFKHFEKDYTPKEKDKLTAICDRLIEDTTRRFQGEFFTPTLWVEEAHRMIEKEFGVDWKNEYVVWDPAWGTGNLTRDYKFKELYVSTLNASDIGLAEQRGYNPEAVKFQYDFLNDSYDKLPQGLRDVIESSRKILVLMNPPYGKPSGHNVGNSGIRSKTNESIVALEMKQKKFGKPSSQLYTQFLFRVLELLPNVDIAVFTPTLFLTGSSFEKFRDIYLERFCFRNGMTLKASHFSNVSKEWGIGFSIWCADGNTKNDFIFSVKELDSTGKIISTGNKTMYNTDSAVAANDWARGEIKSFDKCDSVVCLGPLNFDQRPGPSSRKDGIGYINCGGNNVNTNSQHVGLYSVPYAGGGQPGKGYSPGWVVSDINLNESLALFTARKTITSNWINQKDEYLAPNISHPDYQQWNNDCLVYSLFNNSSNQSSLRNIEYKEKTWDIKNEWFWMSREQMLELANTHGFDALYQDARVGDEERFVYNKLKSLDLSIDALGVLHHAKELVEASFEFREALHQAHPEYHLNCWDAGWYQIKLIMKEFMPVSLKDFRSAYKSFEDRMRDGVYKFGFLK